MVIDERERVLIAERPPGKHLAGRWEFPGGKVEPGEAPALALARELEEEIGITIGTPRPLMRLSHLYPYGKVLLDVWVVRRYRGKPRGLDGQKLRWVSRASLVTTDLLPADRPIIAALHLPERLTRALTPRYRVSSLGDFERSRTDRAAGTTRERKLKGVLCRSVEEAAAAAAAGADFLVMQRILPPGELAALCRVAVPVFSRGSSLTQAWALGASGLNALGSR